MADRGKATAARRTRRMGREETLWDTLWRWSRGPDKKMGPNTQRRKQKGCMLPTKIHKTVAKLEGTTWLSSLQLSLWDNIFGPRVDHVWVGVGNIEEAEDAAARHSLSGELSQEETAPNLQLIETKFHVFSELGFAMTALLFTAPMEGTPSKFSLAMIIPLDSLSQYLIFHRIAEDRLVHLACSLQALLSYYPKETAMNMFNPLLPSFVKAMEALRFASLPSCHDTFFCKEAFIDSNFLSKAITSHLQTCHCTTVIGSDIRMVNTFVMSLSLFLSPKEKVISSLAQKGRGYVPGLLLQGIVGQGVLSDDVLIWSPWPTTLVDLNKQTVRQTRPFHQYALLRHEYMKQEIQQLVQSSNGRRGSRWTAPEGLLRNFEGPSPIVSNIFDETMKLPAPVRETFVAQQAHLLRRKAALFIKFVEYEVYVAFHPSPPPPRLPCMASSMLIHAVS
ncbi:Spindle pole body component, variant 3 [Balamuthia mandrillaris]